ncbi:MAG TPA: GTP-binding protein [Lentisphaeria bacterium]|nr:MAG: GTP-binding protein [Lentisphaerae bacterium GWF2_50_93]HCE45388.1 GTP-binding protein [Lentisphaeria bacterium]
MRYIYRQISDRILGLFKEFPVIIITGARQVGKTTLLKHLFADKGDYVVFDPTIDIENARRDPDLFLDNHKEPLILDEIQYAPELVAAIKRRVDKDKHPGRFILTGSQQWQVLKNISESLAGRAILLELSGFNAAEVSGCTWTMEPWIERWMLNQKEMVEQEGSSIFGSGIGIYEQLFRGALPDAREMKLESLRYYHQSYQQTYIERDIRLLSNIHDYQQFGRFFSISAALTAQEVNYSQLGRDIGLTQRTAHAWLDIMRGTYQWMEVPPYHGNSIKRISGKPKGYLGDTGLACSAQAISSPSAIAGSPLAGALFETWVVNEMKKQCSLMSFPPNMYHWRSHGGGEVDLILERDGVLYPMEIKMTTQPARNDIRGISALRDTYPNANIAVGAIICCTDHAYKVSEDTFAIPWNWKWGNKK